MQYVFSFTKQKTNGEFLKKNLAFVQMNDFFSLESDLIFMCID